MTQALTTLSPILPERTRELNNRLRVVRYTPGMSRPLLALGFIHYARWIIIEWLPPPNGSGGWRGLQWKYLLFESNYDGSDQEYFRAFADILPVRLVKLWGDCFGFETIAERRHAGGRVLVPGGFEAFVRRNSLEVLEHYAAYRHATAIDVRQAIEMKELVDHASRHSDGEQAELRRALKVGPMSLGPVSAPLTWRESARTVCDPWRRAVRGQYGVNPLTIVTPLCVDQEASLREERRVRKLLSGLRGTNTHFARLVIIPPWLTDVGQPDPDRLETSYLVFTSDSWGSAYDQIETIRCKLPDTARLLWARCDGYPGVDSRPRFHAWVDSHTLPTRYYVAGYPPHPVSEIKRRLARRKTVAKAYADQRHPSAAQILTDLDDDGA